MGKKNFNSIPHHIGRELSAINSELIEVACIKKITLNEIKNYQHLEISCNEQGLIIPNEAVIPSEKMGRFSKYNIYGRTIVRKDLPKVDRWYFWDIPIYGDYSKGTITASQKRNVYQREYWDPEYLAIKIELISSSNNVYLVKFSFEHPISKDSSTFDHDLLFRCNILQENLQECHAYAPESPKETYINTYYLDWDIFPPGQLSPEVIYSRSNASKGKVELTEFKKRLEVIRGLNVKSEIQGKGIFSKYFGVILDNDIVIFENTFWGNALYVVYDNWENVSKIPRSELIKMDPAKRNFERIVHGKYWITALSNAINKKP